MKVCLVSSNFQPLPLETWGGLESQVAQQALGLAALGHEVHVLTVGMSKRIETLRADGVLYHRLGIASACCAKARMIGLVAGLVQFCGRANGLCREIRPDIVHFHFRYPCFVSLALAARSTRQWRSIYHAHNWKMAEKMNYALLSPRRAAVTLGVFLDREIVRRCNHVIAISEFIKDGIISTAGVTADRVSVLSNIVDVHSFTPEPIETRRPEILFVGRIAEEKGVLTLVRAMPHVLRALPDVQLSVIGADQGGTERGSYVRTCKEQVSRLHLNSHVRFGGEVANHDLSAYLRRARLLVVPSIWEEPCGLVVLEGLACGIPVVASRVGGIPELIEEGRTGLLVPPGDPDALAKAIIRVLSDDRLLSSAARAGPARVARHHTWEGMARRLETLYRKLV